MIYCKTRYRGNTKSHVISRDTVNRGPVNRGIIVVTNNTIIVTNITIIVTNNTIIVTNKTIIVTKDIIIVTNNTIIVTKINTFQHHLCLMVYFNKKRWICFDWKRTRYFILRKSNVQKMLNELMCLYLWVYTSYSEVLSSETSVIRKLKVFRVIKHRKTRYKYNKAKALVANSNRRPAYSWVFLQTVSSVTWNLCIGPIILKEILIVTSSHIN